MSTREAPRLPLPGERFDKAIVVASVWRNDDPDEGPITALLLLLDVEPEFYRVQHIEAGPGDGREWVLGTDYIAPNIVPAVRRYEDEGGDY